MKASENQIVKFLSTAKAKFSIPVYQRNYNWEEKQCLVLLNDIKKIAEDDSINTHFIGSIVYMSEGVQTTKGCDFSIIDGQQRLTTLNLLLIAMQHKSKTWGEIEFSEMLLETYLINKFSKEDNKMKLILPYKNEIALKFILNQKFEELDEKYLDSNLYKNYKFFANNINKKEDIQVLMDGIEKISCVDIALEKGLDDPQKIFESLNSTGLELSQADLIRNFLLMDLDREKQNDIYENYWDIIESNTVSYKREKKEILLSDFIRDYLTIKLGSITNKKKVFEAFKENFGVLKFEKLKELLNDMRNLSYVYKNILNPNNEQDSEIQRHLKYIKVLDQSVINPFFILIYNDYRLDIIRKKEFIEILSFLESYFIRRYICSESSSGLNKVFAILYSKIKKEKYVESLKELLANKDFPDDEKFKSHLKTKNLYRDKEKLNYILEVLENKNSNERIALWGNNISIEHIFPQKPSKQWQENLDKREFENMFALKDTIANLTLTGSNSNLGNKSFVEKCNLKDLGYKESKFSLNKWLGLQIEWNISTMDERFEVLFEMAQECWKRPQIDKLNISDVIFNCSGPRGSGTGKLLERNKFMILKGAKLSKIFLDNSRERNTNFIKELNEKNLIEEKEDYYLLKENYSATSPSTAALIILGRSANGWTEWKTYSGEVLDEFR